MNEQDGKDSLNSVKIVCQECQRNNSVIAMPSRLGSRSCCTVMREMPRRIKKVAVPTVPDISTETNIGEPMAARDFCKFGCCVILQKRNGLLHTGKCDKSTKSLSNVVHVPSTSTTATTVTPSLCVRDDSHSAQTSFSRRKDYSFRLEKECKGNLINTSPSLSPSMKQPSVYINAQNSDNLSCNVRHRNSAGSNSSHGSSSGFESMKTGSSHFCLAVGTQGTVGNNSSFLRNSSIVCGSSPGLLVNTSQSRYSVQSSSSGDVSLITNNMTNAFDDSGAERVHGDDVEDSSRLSFSDMIFKGMPEAEILALWLGSLGYAEYLAAFLTQGYDLWTIARMTPEDLIALGITHPIHRKFLISEIHRWRINDTWPTLVPSGELRDWLPLIGLPEYVSLFEDQGYCKIGEIQDFMWEDFEDIGIKKLGHLKRLGLAIKKIKDHECGRIQPSGDVQQLVTAALHNKMGAQADYNGLCSHLTTPSPAPTSTFHRNGLETLYGNYCGVEKHLSHIHDALPVEPHAQKQECPHYQSALANETVPCHLEECCEQLMKFDLNKQKISSLQMNLCSRSRILSDENIQRQQLSTHPTKILSTADNSIGSDSEDYPPPPAPLACEGSIQLLKSAFNESVMAATTEVGTTDDSKFEQCYNEINSSSLNEQLSFANDHCGTIRPHHSSTTSASNGDVLNDIGSMLQNLTDELDALLIPSRTIRYSPDLTLGCEEKTRRFRVVNEKLCSLQKKS
ncbi:unnamed protein product [Litomosoides sigmodontis]|uniref:SAM domain-containing protein n=1 Tax=Litomosoides sigmodontis TaxID=42156 RepID=A0A3P6TPG2_LITSI|nr:unnamed protein product [Litomosoides sigmodontis]